MTKEPVLTWEMLAERAMNKADAVFTASSDIISNAVTVYGPQAVDLMLTVIRIDNIQKLIYGGLILLILAIANGLYFRFFLKEYKKRGSDIDSVDTNVIGSGILIWSITVILMLYPVQTVLNVWTWIGVIEPKIWVAKQVVDKITSTNIK